MINRLNESIYLHIFNHTLCNTKASGEGKFENLLNETRLLLDVLYITYCVVYVGVCGTINQ